MLILRIISLLVCLALLPRLALAQEDVSTKSLDAKGATVDIGETYISPFLERDRINIVAIGDWMAHGVWWGMYERFNKDKSVSFTRNTNYGSGFVRKERLDWNARIVNYTSRKRVDVAVVALGINDGRDLKLGAEIHAFNSSKWREIYTARVDQFIVSLKQHGSAIYWLGLPVVKNPQKAEANKIINGIFKQLARKNEIKFIDSWYEFTDTNGQFTYAGLDINDAPKILRAKDGLHFTMSGYRKMGKLVERTLSADLSAMDAAAQTSLKGSREREIALSTPDAGRKGNMTPEFNALLENRDNYVTYINQGPVITGSVKQTRAIIDPVTSSFGRVIDEMTPRAITETKVIVLKTPEITPQTDDTNLASPEMSILVSGGHLAAKPGRDDDYTWVR